jgi:acetoin utilization deacetylase AcuC-like enzyme
MKSTERVHRGHRDHSNPTNSRHSPPWHHPSKQKRARTARKTRVQTRSRGQAEEGEQQPSEIVNIDEIPSPETTPVHSTPILEEIQQPAPEGMNTDIPTEVQEPQNQEAETLKEVQPENTRPVPGRQWNEAESGCNNRARRVSNDHIRPPTGGSGRGYHGSARMAD